MKTIKNQSKKTNRETTCIQIDSVTHSRMKKLKEETGVPMGQLVSSFLEYGAGKVESGELKIKRSAIALTDAA